MRSGTLFLAFIPLAVAIASAQPTIVINTTQVRIAHTINVTNAATNTVADSIMVLNGSNSSFTATVNPGAPWLLINGGTSATGQTPGNITIGYNPAGLTPGTYTGQIMVAVANVGTEPIDVSLTIGGPLLEAQGTTLIGVTGGAPVSTTVNVTSTASANGDEIAYTISSVSSSGWLTATAVNGNTTTPGAITVTATPGALVAGTYTGTISLAPTNAQLSPLILTITFIVTEPTVVATLPGGATSVNFNLNSPPMAVNLTNSVTPSSPVQFTASASPSATWLTLNGGAGPVTGATPATLTLGLSPSAMSLAIGEYTGLVTINLTGATNSSIVIPVTLTAILPPGCMFTFTGTGTLTYTGTATLSSMAPGGVYPSIPQRVTVTSSASCPAGTAFTVTADHPEWLNVTQTPTGFTFNALSNPHSTGRTATVTVTPANTGNSAGAPPTTFSITEPASPLPRAQREVVALYEQLLGREPDQGGFNFWNGQGAAGLGLMADSFLISPEAQNSDFQVLAEYQAALGRFPTFTEYSMALTSLRTGSSPSDLFTQLLGASTNSTAATTAIYLNLLGRAPTSAELNAGLAMTPFQLYTALLAGTEFQDRSNPLYIKLLYFVILQRDSDPAGFNFWLNVANGGGPGIYFNSPATRLTILGDGQPGVGFLGSNEFQSLFQ